MQCVRAPSSSLTRNGAASQWCALELPLKEEETFAKAIVAIEQVSKGEVLECPRLLVP